MLTVEQAAHLRAAVSAGRSIAISGATGTGKTTLLSSLLACIPETERVILLEETREIPTSASNIVSLVTRGPNPEGAGAIDLADLVRSSLRMRPDRIVVGEVRGAEALAMLAAMNTGQQGSLVTVHASSAAQVTDRIVALASQGSTSLGEDTVRAWAADAWDLRVHLERVEGRRCIREIREG